MPDSKISIPENILRWADDPALKGEPAIISRIAGAHPDRIVTWSEFRDEVSRWEQVLEDMDVGKGDVVAAYLPNTPEARFIRLAALNRGAVFTAMGSDKGEGDLVDRFGQAEPKVLIAADGYTHMKMGKDGQPVAGSVDRLEAIAKAQAEIPSLKQTLVLPFLNEKPDLSSLKEGTRSTADILEGVQPREMKYNRWDYNHISDIMYSSGSSGPPKAFEHTTGDTVLLNHKELIHCGIGKGSRVNFHSTLSWMMAPWADGAGFVGATNVIYEGNIGFPDPAAQLKLASDHKLTHLGTAADVIQDLWMKNDVHTLDNPEYDLSHLEKLMYTASVLSPEGYGYV